MGGHESTQEVEKDILFGREDIKHSTRTERPVGVLKSIQSCVSMLVKIEEEDQTRTERPEGGQESTTVEELDIDFRAPGLSRAVVKEAEHFRVQELVKKIESHPHREALQADLQQNNVYNPFSNNSKSDDPRIGQCRVIRVVRNYQKYNVLTVFFIGIKELSTAFADNSWFESESRRKFNKLRLDALSVPHCVIKKGRCHDARHGKTKEQKEYQKAWNAWKRCCKKVDSQGGHFTGIHDRFLRDPGYRESQLAIGWTEQKCKEMDELAKEKRTYHLSTEEFKRYQGQCISP